VYKFFVILSANGLMIKKISPCKTLLVWGDITLKGKLYIFEYGMHENQELYENSLPLD